MNIKELLRVLESMDAIIVHCSRSNRGGEHTPKPLYPTDLRETMNDLTTVSGRSISCSVVWPAHQDAFGEIGIIVRPRAAGEIVRLSVCDGGTLADGQGAGEPLSKATVAQTFTAPNGHNEWVLIGGEVVGIFLNFKMGLYVARLLDTLPGMDAGEAAALGFKPEPYPHRISIPEIAADFPGLPLFGFVEGRLVELGPINGALIERHPYSS